MESKTSVVAYTNEAADSKGVEIDVGLFNGMFMNAGYAYTDAQYKDFNSSSQSNANAGNRVRYAPKHLLNYGHDNRWKSGLGLGMNHVSENFTQSNFLPTP